MPVIKHAEAADIAREAIVLNLGDLDREAARLRERAEQRAAAIISAAKTERDELTKGAAERGHAEGFAEGRQEGLAEGREAGRAEAIATVRGELAQLEGAWRAALEAFGRERESLLSDARQDVLRLAVAIAQRVTRRMVSLDGEQVERTLEAALSLTLEPTKLVVRVCPDDLAVAEQVLPGVFERLGLDPHSKLVDDEALTQGSVVVRTDTGEIDASIETQLERLVDAALGPKTNSDEEPDRSDPADQEPIDNESALEEQAKEELDRGGDAENPSEPTS